MVTSPGKSPCSRHGSRAPRQGRLDSRGRHPPRPLRDPLPARRGRHGRGVPREGHEARPRRRDQGAAGIAFADPERLARFEREAHVLASLNHPNIASIYGLEESTSVKALVLELVEGQTLQDRIEAGPIPVDEALSDREADRRSAGSGAREGHRPPGPEARERQDRPGGQGQGSGLRPREGARPVSPRLPPRHHPLADDVARHAGRA